MATYDLFKALDGGKKLNLGATLFIKIHFYYIGELASNIKCKMYVLLLLTLE